ncbi:hypothetical protein HYH03_005721 [Edaphochlamys debaryana]|uniref:Uncharacterized protein n=1 Tax=Edaphochlamys debaryana TaxID=47281 RepID=A0A835Y7D4_9CHLO|nr:hypothetical protein HYH03_005721 [Edaphochlamys debaryana]|eukprot:KAG2496118.1 hypothetical protein HYH03_005721 [Edaphochlamys debaryana]
MSYQPTAAVRIQEISRVLGIDRVKVQFWDCSGSPQFQSYWPVLAKELDGLLMVVDPSRPDQERDLETFYRNFAEPNNLYTRQCMVMAIQVQKEGGGLGGWQGLQGGLKKLAQSYVSINPTNPAAGVQEAYQHLDVLFSGALQSKKEALESSYMQQEE